MVHAFVPLLMAHGALFPETWPTVHLGATLPQYRLEILLLVLVLLLLILGPLAVRRSWPGRSERACGSTGRWPSATCVSSIPSGCAVAPRPMRR